MAEARTWILRAALVALALMATGLPSAPRVAAQAFDCSGTDWVANSAADFESAIGCWDTAAAPGMYSITLGADVTGQFIVHPRTADRSLVIDAGGRTLTGSLSLVGRFDAPPEDRSSPLTLRNLVFGSTPGRGGLGIGHLDHASIEDVTVLGGNDGIVVADASATITRLSVLGLHPINALETLRARVLLQDSVIESIDDDPALLIDDSAVIIRNSIIRDTNGLFEFADKSEILFDRSAILDNDVNLLELVSSHCCRGSTVSFVNSTYAQNDANAPLTLGIPAPEGALVQVANSTVLTNGEFGLIGPVQTRSSLVDRCEPPGTVNLGEGNGWPADEFDQGPVDLGANAGGCFGTTNLHHHPLDDYGCVVPTPAGCVPTYAITAANAARGAGACTNTIVPTAVDLFDIELDQLRPGETSVLTTTGTQLVDGRGFPRTSCDAGSYESDGTEPVPPSTLRVASFDVDHPVTNGDLPLDYGGWDLANLVEANNIDVFLLQRVMKGPYGDQLTDQLIEELNRRGISLLDNFAPAFDSDPDFPEYQIYFGGQLVLSRFPFIGAGATPLPSPDPDALDTTIHWVLMETPSETIRLVNMRGHDTTPCDFVRSLADWLDDQPPLTTIVAGNLAADRPFGCVGEFAAGWVDACASAVADATCARTLDLEGQDITNDFFLHRPQPGSPVSLTAARTILHRPAVFSNHRAVVADYALAGAPGDADGDGIDDAIDDCPTVANDGLADRDGDGVGDVCDPVLDGDANCDAGRDIIDALVIAQFDAAIRTGVTGCPLGNPATELYTYGADANNDGSANIIDALLIAQCDAGIDNVACPFVPPAD